MNTRRDGRLWLVFLAALACGCDLPGAPSESSRPVPANQVLEFNALYAMRCAGCHGSDGKLGPAPPLNDPIFLAIIPDAELLRVIREGRSASPGQKSPMPAFASNLGGPLTDDQVNALAEGIKKQWLSSTPASPELPTYLASAGGGNKEEGGRVFERACAECHGAEGRGQKDGRSLRGGALNDQAFLALVSDQALRRIIITGRPDLGMPAFDGKMGRPADFQALTPTEIEDLLSLLKDWRQKESRDIQVTSRD